MWVGPVFNLCMALIFAGYLLRAVRRYERRADAIMARMDEVHAAELKKYDDTRDEIRVSMRYEVDRAIAGNHLRRGGPYNVLFLMGHGRAVDTLNNSTYLSSWLAEIAALPRSAQVAFAARCARRVLVLFRHLWLGSTSEQAECLSTSIAVAERAGQDLDGISLTEARMAAAVAEGIADAASDSAVFVATYVADAAGTAAQLAANVASLTASPELSPVAPAAHASAAGFATILGGIDRMICDDLDHIRRHATANGSIDAGPVPPSLFGPLWPDGPPKGWPKPEKPSTKLRIEFDVPDDMSDDDALDFVKRLSVELCRLHVAGGGHGVAIQPPLEMDVPVGANKPAPEPALA